MPVRKIPSRRKHRTPFPLGRFRGTVAEMEDTEAPDGAQGSISFQLVDNTLVEGDVEPGARINFVRIPTWKEVETEVRGRKRKVVMMTAEIDPTDEENVPFPLRDAAMQFADLAVALGVEQLDGADVEFDLEGFIEKCRTKKFNGMEVEYEVTHRPEKRDGKIVEGGRTFVDTVFLPFDAEEGGGAVSDESEDEEEEEDEEEVEEEGEGEEEEEEEEDEEDEEEEEEEEEEEAPPAPKRTRSLLGGAKRRQRTTKASGAKKGSGKPKFRPKKKK